MDLEDRIFRSRLPYPSYQAGSGFQVVRLVGEGEDGSIEVEVIGEYDGEGSFDPIDLDAYSFLPRNRLWDLSLSKWVELDDDEKGEIFLRLFESGGL